jgi:hypothetical protein
MTNKMHVFTINTRMIWFIEDGKRLTMNHLLMKLLRATTKLTKVLSRISFHYMFSSMKVCINFSKVEILIKINNRTLTPKYQIKSPTRTSAKLCRFRNRK